MEKFIERPSIVEAIQFKGGNDSAEEVCDVIEKAGEKFTASWYKEHEEPFGDEGETSTVPEQIVVENDGLFSGALYVDWWLVKDEDGALHAASAEAFEAVYQPLLDEELPEVNDSSERV